MNKLQTVVLVGGSLVSASLVRADDIGTTLTTAATTAVGSAATNTGTILVAALGIAVGFVVYKLIKRALGKA